MTPAPVVSIVLIFLNEERFLPEAIESVLAQTHTDWELLLVDDGSVDASTGTAREYARRHSDRVRYLEHPRHENLGMSAARNLGISQARGEFLSVIDADDAWLPRKLEQQLALFEVHRSVAVVCGRSQWWHSWTKAPGDEGRDFVPPLGLPPNTVVQPPAFLKLFVEDEYASLKDLLVRRSAVEAVGGYEAAFRGMYEDQVFHAKLSVKYPIFVAGDTWYRYRQHPQSCVAVAESRGGKDEVRRRFLSWLLRYLKDQHVTDRALARIVRQQQFRLRYPFIARLRNGLIYHARRLWRRRAHGGAGRSSG